MTSKMDHSTISRILNYVKIDHDLKKYDTTCSSVSTLKTILKDKAPSLLGSNATYAEISQWISFAWRGNTTESDLNFLNSHLLFRSYLVGQQMTVADIIVFDLLTGKLKVVTEHSEVARWFDQLSYQLIGSSKLEIKKIQTELPFAVKPKINPNEQDQKLAAADSNKVIPKNQLESKALEGAKQSQTSKPSDDNSKPKAKPSNASTGDKKDTKTVGDTPSKPSDDGAKAKAKSSNPSSTEKKEEGGSGSDISPTLLDIRVGYVSRTWNHPDSEKLICEEIDLGEASGPRQIASGIRAFYTAEQVQGRRVLVLCNLKERALAGFKSQGMVLAASNADHSVVRLLEAPADSKPGDRVEFVGATGALSGDPATPAQMAKKKIWEALAPELRTNDAGVVVFKGIPVLVGSQICKAELSDGAVS